MSEREDRRLSRVSRICAELPEATRDVHASHASFRVGWVALRLDRGAVDWKEVAELVCESYCLTAPKKLAASAPTR